MIRMVWVSVLVASLANSFASAQEPEIPGWLSKDFAHFTELFEGRWDNDRHVFFAREAGVDPATLAPRQHIEIRRVVLPANTETEPGSVTFNATRTVKGEEPVALVHTLAIDPLRQTLRQTIAAPGGLLPPKTFDCQIDWVRNGGQFNGMASGSECETLFPRPQEGGGLEVSFSLSEQDFWVVSERGPNQVEARMRRARPFECWAAVLRGAGHGESGEGLSDWDFRRGVALHDQGGEAELITDEDPARRVRLKLRDVDWTYGTNRPSLTLYVLEGDSDRAVSYAWGEAEAERIGINLRWMQASCTHMPENNED